MSERLNPFEPEEEQLEGPPEALPLEIEPLPVDSRARWKSLAGLGVLFLFHAFQVVTWNASDTTVPSWDGSAHLAMAADHRGAFKESGFDPFRLPEASFPPFPPLYHAALIPALGADHPVAAARWVNFFFLVLLCAAVWGLGLHYAGEWPALGAAVLISCAPVVQELLREPLPDLALSAMTALTYFCLAKSEGFKRTPFSLAAGLFAAAAMWTKWGALTFFLPVLPLLLDARKDRKRAARAALFLLVAAGLAVPWYWANWPRVQAYLIGTASVNGIQFWRGFAIFTYIGKMLRGLEAPFFILSFWAVMKPTKRRRREDTWLLFAWFMFSLIFWSFLPHRETRFILPALVPLAVITVGPWSEKALVYLCAAQVLFALNFARGWVPPLEFRAGVTIGAFASRPPVREDWKIADVLGEAARLQPVYGDKSGVAILADHPRMNILSAEWERARLGLDRLRVQGIDARGCEFADFLIDRTDPVDGEGRIPGFRKARRDLLAFGGWFDRSFSEVRRWKLPDGSEAVLYKRKIPREPPFGTRRAVFHYFADSENRFGIRNLVIDFGGWDARRGLYPRLTVRMDEIESDGASVKGVAFVMEEVLFVPFEAPRAMDPGWMQDSLSNVRFLKLKRLKILAGSIDEASALLLFERAYPKLRKTRISFDGGAVIRTRLSALPLRAGVDSRVSEDPGALVFRLARMRVAGVPVPVGLLSSFGTVRFDFEPSRARPFGFEAPPIEARAGKLEFVSR